MTLSMSLYWKAPDASASINGRLKDVANKGFVAGATLTPVGGSLQIDVSDFTCITFDGAVVRSDTTERLSPVVDGVVNYVVLRARYVLLGSPILQLQVMTAASFAGDPEADWLHVVGTIDLTAGGPHADVPSSAISYTLRDAVDPQGRSSWREPVANAAALPVPPLDSNRHGDIRMALDTGSLWWWNDSLATWEIFDEVAVQSHQDHEHTNGITGDSDSTTLEPSVNVSDIEIAGVPAGSGYVVNGRYNTAPAGVTTILGSSLPAVRGTVQVYIDETGTITNDMRVQLLAEPMDISAARIADISKDHPLGTFVLSYTGGTLSWDNGEPVAVTTGNTYRLYSPDYTAWIDVDLVGALPGATVTDTYQVNASGSTDDELLLAHFFWDGTSVLVLSRDKRSFGNLGYTEMSDAEFKTSVLDPRQADLRGSSIVSGGEMEEISAPSLNLRVYGPVVAYVDGKRLVCDGSYDGIALPDASTRYVYVVPSTVHGIGTLTVSATNPTTVVGLKYARLGSITTAGGEITEINDLRTSHLRMNEVVSFAWDESDKQVRLVGHPTTNSTRDVQLQAGVLHTSTGMLSSANFGQRLKFIDGATTLVSGTVTLTNGATTVTGSGTSFLTQLAVGTRVVVLSNGTTPEADSTVNGYGVYRIASVTSDTVATLSASYQGVTGSSKQLYRVLQLTNSAINDLALLQPFNTDTSILGAINDGQVAQRAGLGITSGCGLTLAANSLTIGTGDFVDPYRRVVDRSSADVVDFTAAADGTWVVYWDSSAKAFARVLAATGVVWREDLIFAVVIRSGGTNTELHDARLFSGGHDCASYVSVGPDTSPIAEHANFRSLKAAVVHLGHYDTTSYTPNVIKVLADLTIVADDDFLDFDAAELTTASSRLRGLVIENGGGADTSLRTVTWGDVGVAAGIPLINDPPVGTTIRGLKWAYVGDANLVNDDLCWIKDAEGLTVERCSWLSSTGLSFLAVWDVTMGACAFRDCTLFQTEGEIVASGATALFDLVSVGTTDNSLSIENCSFRHYQADYDSVFRLQTPTDVVDVNVTNSLLQNFTVGVFDFGGSAPIGSFSLKGTRIRANASTASIADDDGVVSMSDCVIDNIGIRLDGAGVVSGLRTVNSATVTTSASPDLISLVGCQVEISGTPGFDSISGSDITITTAATLRCPFNSGCRAVNSHFLKSNAAGTSVIFEVTSGRRLLLNNCFLEHSGAGGTLDSCISVTGQTKVSVIGCHIDSSSRNIQIIDADFSDPAASELIVANNNIKGDDETIVSVVRSSLAHFSDHISVTGNVIQCGAPVSVFYLDSGGVSSSFKTAVYANNTVRMADGGLVDLSGASSLSFNNNVFEYTAKTAGPSQLYFGSGSSTRQLTLSVCGNTVTCNADVDAAGSIDFSIVADSYITRSINHNKIHVTNAGTGDVDINIVVYANDAHAVSVIGNVMTMVCPDVTSTATHTMGISVAGSGVTDLFESTINANQLVSYVSSGSATTTVLIEADYTENANIAGNTVCVVAGDVDLTVTANVARAIVDGNNIRTNGGTSTITNGATSIDVTSDNIADVIV